MFHYECCIHLEQKNRSYRYNLYLAKAINAALLEANYTETLKLLMQLLIKRNSVHGFLDLKRKDEAAYSTLA